MDFLTRSIRLFTFSRINVRIHILYLIWMALRLFQGDSLSFELTFLGMLFLIILLHEFGHCFGARSVGGDAEEILMWPLGGLAFAHAPMTPWAQFVTVICGPLVNVALCILSAAILIIATGDIGVVSLNVFAPFDPDSMTAMWQYYVGIFYWLNYMLLCFNMLPVFPFDGGQIFRTLIWPYVGLHRATIIAAQIGIIGAVAFGVWGASIGNIMLIAIAVFGGMTSFQHLQAARFGMLQEEFRTYASTGRYHRKRPGFFARLAGLFKRSPRRDAAAANPNPGGWDRRIAEEERLEAEVDRILKKVHDHGVSSLSYVERQTLERATRERQKRELDPRL